MSENYRFYAGRPNRKDYSDGAYGKLPHIPECVRYYWHSDALMGAHEYGDNVIVDTRGENRNHVIFACDDDDAAEWLCEVLNSQCVDKVWD